MTKKNVNNGKNDNAFVRFIKAVFVKEIGLKAIALVAAVAFWFLAIGLGSVLSAPEAELPFWSQFGQNITERFTGALNITTSIFDILFLFITVYFVMHFLYKSSSSVAVVIVGIFVTGIIILTSSLLNFPVMGTIFSGGILFLFMALVIMFPQDLRRFIFKASSKSGKENKVDEYDCTEEELHTTTNEIVKAVLSMSKDNLGAIIIITPRNVPQHILDSGTRLNSQLSQPLIECLFNTHANLHDGAVFIHGNKILAAGCFLPLSQTQSIAKELGTRHRAALGISEQYDVLAIVVSEETGIISVARDGVLERYYDAAMLTDVIEETYGIKSTGEDTPDRNKKRGKKNR